MAYFIVKQTLLKFEKEPNAKCSFQKQWCGTLPSPSEMNDPKTKLVKKMQQQNTFTTTTTTTTLTLDAPKTKPLPPPLTTLCCMIWYMRKNCLNLTILSIHQCDPTGIRKISILIKAFVYNHFLLDQPGYNISGREKNLLLGVVL